LSGAVGSLTRGLLSSSLHRLVQQYGNRLVELQAAEAEATVKVPPTVAEGEPWRAVPERASEVMSVSMDGAMIDVRGERWKQVKTVASSAEEPVDGPEEYQAPGQSRVQPSRHSYRAGLCEAAVFANQQWAEATRRGLEKARQTVSVNDRALRIWGQTVVAVEPPGSPAECGPVSRWNP